ncbi:uncharacterized protein [Argopecten irradians]|uniref:uncharacterized protein n=1 Tax=Argopecten irradians TaxID=31199 RepID=UPI00371485B1
MVSRAMGSRLMIAGHKGNTKYVQMKKLIVYYFSGLSNRINFRPVINNPSSLLAGKCNAVNVSQVLVELCDIVKYSCCKKYQTKTWMVHLSNDLNSPVPNILTKSELGWTNGYDLVLCENSDKKLSLKSSSDVVGNPAATDCDLDKGERNKLSDQKHVNVADSNGNSTSAIDFQIDESNDSEDTRVKREIASLDQYLSLDCEFVGDLPKVSTDKQLGNYLGGCSIVDFDGNVVYDMKICEKDTITDCGTRYSGRHAGHNIDGVTFEDVRNTVTNLLKVKIEICKFLK